MTSIEPQPPAPLDPGEARRLTDEVKGDAAALWAKLLRLYEGGAHLALGYSSWGAYFEAEFGQRKSQGYRLLEAARVQELSPQLGNGHLNEAQARELAVIEDPEERERVWLQAVETYGPDPTAAQIAAIRDAEPSVHFSSDSPEWYTPSAILERVTAAIGPVDLDPCSNRGTPNVPAGAHFTEEDDGLSQDWAGAVFMNPPYGRGIDAWVCKLAVSYEAGAVTAAIALVPARTDTAWFRHLRDYPVCFISGRLQFSDHPNSAPFPSAVFYLGPDTAAFRRAFADAGDVYRRFR